MGASQSDKAQSFRALHDAAGHFIIANAWDAGSARILTGLGFAALATSSGAQAGVLEHEERDIIERVLRLADKPVRAIMTPRTELAPSPSTWCVPS